MYYALMDDRRDAAIQHGLDAIHDKLAVGRRLSAEDGLFLLRPETSLHVVGQLAAERCREKHGRTVFYNLNSHLNPTNVCVYRCKLCAFYRADGHPEGYFLSFDEILRRGQEAWDYGCTEMHIVGGLPPDRPFDWYVSILRILHEAFPKLHLKAWTAVEIAWFARISGKSVAQVLETLMEAGLGSLPGGGAEIFHPEVRSKISAGKADADSWLEIHRTAHRLGLRSNATMLFGHVEQPRHRVDHWLRLRELQDETGGFQAFVPLPFHPHATALAHLPKPAAMDNLRTIAVSRLMLDNFDHIKAYWISLGVGVAQTALAYGANDLDGTVRQESIYHEAGSDAPEVLTVGELCGLIREAGREPVERDSLYRRVRRNGREWEIELDPLER